MAALMVNVTDLKAGNVLADNVISVNGKILLGKDSVLTPKQISLLTAWDVQNVFITCGEDAAEPAAETAVPAQQQSGEMDATHLQFVQEYDSVISSMAQAFDFIRKRNIVPVPLLKTTAGSIYSTIKYNDLIMNYLLISDYKLADFISRHSVMVAFFAGIIARQLKWNEDDIKGVALAGLLHDLGNLVTAKVDNPRTQSHVPEAAALLKNVKNIPGEVLLGVVQHRECIDGSGIPTGVNGLKIHPYAKIIAVADLFHCQAYNDEYANPFPVLDLLAHEMFGKLEPSVCHSFINRVRDSLLNNKILLTTGEEAEVIYFHPTTSCLPIVKTANNQIIDLAQNTGLSISRILPPS